MAAENVVNDTESTNCNNLSTLAIFHAVQAAQGQLQQQNMDVDVPFIGKNIPAINRDYDIHQKVSDSQSDTEDQLLMNRSYYFKVFKVIVFCHSKISCLPLHLAPEDLMMV